MFATVCVWCGFNVQEERERKRDHLVSVQTDVSAVTAGIPSTSTNFTCSQGARHTDIERGRVGEMRLSELLSIYFILLLFEPPSLAATLKHQNECSTDKAWNRLGGCICK